MQLLDSEQIEIADEYFRFRAINPPCAGNCVSVHSGGRTAACPVPRSAEATVRQLPALYPQTHADTHVCSLAPCSTQGWSATCHWALTKAWGHGQEVLEEKRRRGRVLTRKGEKMRRKLSLGQCLSWTWRKKRWWILPVEIFKANEAKASAQKNNSNPNSLVVRSYFWAHFIRQSRVIPFFCWDQAIKTQV